MIFCDLRIAMRSLWRVAALWITVALELLRVLAPSPIFGVVRAVLLRPLASRHGGWPALRAIERSEKRCRERGESFTQPIWLR